MQQNIPRDQNGLLSRSALAIYGATKHAAIINLTHNSAAAVTFRRNAAIEARDASDAGIVALRNLRRDLELKWEEARTFALLTRDLLRAPFGRKYSQAWAGTGFTNTLAVPTAFGALETLVESLAGFLTDNPGKESASSGVTAAAAGTLHGEMRALRLAVQGKEADLRTLNEIKQSQFDALRRSLVGQAQELKQLIPALDNRWLDFGLNIPGQKERPEVPTNIVVTPLPNNALAVDWDKSARAKSYRVWLRVVGDSGEMNIVGNPADPDFTIQSPPANALVEIALSALNDGGESSRTQVIAVRTAG